MRTPLRRRILVAQPRPDICPPAATRSTPASPEHGGRQFSPAQQLYAHAHPEGQSALVVQDCTEPHDVLWWQKPAPSHVRTHQQLTPPHGVCPKHGFSSGGAGHSPVGGDSA